jgi:hypothetical protein
MPTTEYDSALPVRGDVVSGTTVDANEGLVIIGGNSPTDSKWYPVTMDATGHLQITGAGADGASVVGYPVRVAGEAGDGKTYTLLTDTTGASVVVGAGVAGSSVVGNPVLVAGESSDGKTRTIATDTSGRLLVNIGGGTKATPHFAGSVLLVKATPNTVLTLAGPVTVKNILVSGSGLMKIEIQEGVTASETTKWVAFNSTAVPNWEFDMNADGFDVITGHSIKVYCTNLEQKASPASDFTGYATIVTEDAS